MDEHPHLPHPFEDPDFISGVHEGIIRHVLEQLDQRSNTGSSEALQALGALSITNNPLSERIIGTWVAALLTDGLPSEYALHEMVQARDSGTITDSEYNRILFLAQPDRLRPDGI